MLADDRLDEFYDNPNALRDYFRDIGRMVLAAEGRKANDSHTNCYQYFCLTKYGTVNGRRNFHAVIFMWMVPTGSFFLFQAEDGIRDSSVTGVQTCALPISMIWEAALLGGASMRGVLFVAGIGAIGIGIWDEVALSINNYRGEETLPFIWKGAVAQKISELMLVLIGILVVLGVLFF